jgi:protease-4
MELNDVRELADGRIFSGRQALAAGLIDELGTLRDAVKHAAKLGHISGEPRIVYPPEEDKSLLDYFLDKTQARLEEFLLPQRYGLSYLWHEG